MLLNCGVGEDSWESLGLQGDPTSPSERKSVLGCSLEGLMLKLKLQYFGHLMWRANSLEKILMLGNTQDRRRRERQRMRWLDGITDWMGMSLSKPSEIVKGREIWCAAVHGVAKIRTQLGNWTMNNNNSNVSSLAATNVLYQWRILTMWETGYGVYGNFLFYLYKFSTNLKLL